MTTEKLQEILESDKKLSISEIEQIIYELKPSVKKSDFLQNRNWKIMNNLLSLRPFKANIEK